MQNDFQIGEKVYYFLDEETPYFTGTITFINDSYAKIKPDIPTHFWLETIVVYRGHFFRDADECWKEYNNFIEEKKENYVHKIYNDKTLISFMYGILRHRGATYSELKAIEESMRKIYGEVLYGLNYDI